MHSRPDEGGECSASEDELNPRFSSVKELYHSLSSLLRYLARYFTNAQDLHPEDAREKSREICAGLAETGIGVRELIKTTKRFQQNEEGQEDDEEEMGARLMEYFKVRV